MRKTLSGLIVFGLLLVPTQLLNAATVKAGASCVKLGQNQIVNGYKYTCIKSGKKLVWNKGTAIPKAPTAIPTISPNSTPSPSPSPSSISLPTSSSKNSDLYAAPSEKSDNLDICKVKEVNINGPRNGRGWNSPDAPMFSLPSGFPSVTSLTQRNGSVKWALIPIDFPDLHGETNFRLRVDDQMTTLSDWYRTVSEGKLQISWVVAKDWVRLPASTDSYAIGNSANIGDVANGAKLFQDAMKSADPSFDFSNVQNVVFLLPKGQTFLKETSQGFPWDKAVRELVTNEGPISSFSIAGVFMDQPNKDYWGYWAHEFGHAISLPHIGASRPPAPLFAGFDLMANQDGPTRELSGWLRFVAQWLPDDKVYCKDANGIKDLELTLVPLNSSEQGLKLAVITLSPSKAIVIESRRETKFSCKMTPIQNGAFAYVYDANLSHGQDFLIPITPINRPTVQSPCPAPPMVDSLLRFGDKVTFEGITIENLSSGNFDKVRISK